MSDSAIFGEAVFGEAVFGSSGTASTLLQDTYATLDDFHTAVESVDDAKFVRAFTFIEAGTNLQKIAIVRKA